MKLAKHFQALIKAIGDNPNRAGLKDTPKRMEKAYAEWFKGYRKPDFNFTTFDNKYRGMVVRKAIPFQSFCEHHLARYHGTIDFAYIPNGEMVGLSKIPRLLQHYSARLTVQEDLTDFLIDKFNSFFSKKPLGTFIIIKGRHSCESTRGVKVDALTITSSVRGVFEEQPHAKQEALQLLA